MAHSTKQNTARSFWTKRAALVASILVILAIAGRLSLSSSLVLEWMKESIVEQFATSMEGEIQIGEVSGDIWNTIQFKDIYLEQDSTEIRIKEASMRLYRWSIFTGLTKLHQLDIKEANLSILYAPKPSSLDKEKGTPEDLHFVIDKLSIANTNIDILFSQSALSVSDIGLNGSLAMENASFDFGLSDFEAKIYESNFGDTLALSSNGSVRDGVVSLDEILIASGKTLIKANGSFNTDTKQLEGSSQADPLSWEDIQKIDDSSPIKESIETDISIKGKLEAFDVQITANAPGLPSFTSITSLSYDSTLYASRIEFRGSDLDTGILFADSNSVFMKEYSFIAKGHIPVLNQNRSVNIQARVAEITYQEKAIDSLVINGSLEQSVANLEIEGYRESELASISLVTEDLYDEFPGWILSGGFGNIDSRYWGLAGTGQNSLNGTFLIEGIGWVPNQEKWVYEVDLKPSLFCDINISKGKFVGWIDDYFTSIDGKLEFKESVVSGNFGGAIWEENPKYTFRIETEHFDLADVTDREAVSSDFHVLLQGTGEGLNPENLVLDIESNIYEGTINQQTIQGLSALVEVRDSVLTIQNAELKSDFADGTITARQNYIDFSDPSNRATYNLDIKNISVLAPFIGVDSLYAQGNIQGEIDQTIDGFSVIRGALDLEGFGLNDYVKTGSITGATDIIIGTDNSYNFSVQVQAPKYKEVEFQDFLFASYGKFSADSVNGRFDIQVNAQNVTSIKQSGTYQYNSSERKLDGVLSSFDFESSRRSFVLEEPVAFVAGSSSFTSDTLSLISSEDVFLKASITYRDSVNRAFFIESSNIDIGIAQEVALKERLFGGDLSGVVRFNQTPGFVEGSGVFEVDNLDYKGAVLDKFSVTYDIANEVLVANLSSAWEGEEKVSGMFELPYLPGDPNLFDDSFFDRKVSGAAFLNPTSIDHFESLLSSFGIQNTDGTLTGKFRLLGTAGDPEFIGNATLSDARLSGVRVDSLTALFDYIEEEKEIQTGLSLFALGQIAASIDARLPFYADFKKLTLDLPQDTDSLKVQVVTDDLNLSVLNDFITTTKVNSIRGYVNGEVDILGTVANPTPSGSFSLIDGAFTVPETGVTVSGVYSDLSIQDGKVLLDSLVMESGEGRLMATGDIDLEGITPSALNLDIEASNFLIIYNDEAEVAVDATADLQGTVSTPEIVGDILVNEGFYFAPEFGDRDIESVELEIDQVAEMDPTYDSLALDINVTFDDDFILKNRLYLTQEVKKLQGELSMTKSPGRRLSVNGTIWSEEGFARPLGKQFELEEARYTFVGNPGNPEVFSIFMYQPPTTRRRTEQGIQIYYLIEGTLEDTKYVFESEPELDQRDIIAYILFGKPYYSLNSVQQSLTSVGNDETVDDEALQLLVTRAEALATQQLGVDLVEVSTFRQGTSRGTAIQTGWYINERTFFRIINEIGSNPKILFVLEYLVNQNLDLIITQGNDRRQGVDLQWIFDY